MSTTAAPSEKVSAPVAPEDFRDRFSADTAGDYQLLRDAIRSAMEATRSVSISCPHCNRSSKHEIADHRSALDAARFAVEQGFGKAPSTPEKPTAPSDRLKPIHEMTLAELEAERREIFNRSFQPCTAV